VVLAIIAVLILLLGTIWAGGGFERRRDLVQAYPPGTTLDAGSFTLRIDRVEARFQPDPGFGHDEPYWELHAHGTATNTTEEGLALYRIGVLALPDGWVYRGQDFNPMMRTSDGKLVTNQNGQLAAGMADVPVRIRSELPAEWEPTGHVYVGVQQQAYAAHRIDQGFTDKWWGNDRGGKVLGFWVPVTVLPEGAL
jgi:hypothetical protein